MNKKNKKQTRRPQPSAKPITRQRISAPKPQLFDQMAAPIPHTVTNKSLGVQDMMDKHIMQGSSVSSPRKEYRAEQSPKSRVTRAQARKRRNRRRVAAALIAAAVIITGFTLSVTVLFKIESFAVEGNSPYALEELAFAFAHPIGENIFAFSANEAQSIISKALPYIETVTIRRRLPGTVVFKVTQSFETYYIPTDSGYVVLSASLKILRISAEEPTGLVAIIGAEPSVPAAGDSLALVSAEKLEALYKLLAAIDTEQLDKIGTIDISSELEMSMIYDGRAKVIVGTQNDLEDKLAVAKTVLVNHIADTEQGTLDVSHQNENEHRNGIWRAGKF